eukprot:CAMPEP_0175114994 /NCGR_PEP_ID=MMETSP0086_2-20121207/17238_1 /TAXON_ID=136419 /ORGANISM="Unknown Unknown, Strain D1" /LENGTH=57 /DNA_ID=CAMNT_0016394851 /DNA_START=129 /DNA_END=298 /DNA_ORIENTATION=-
MARTLAKKANHSFFALTFAVAKLPTRKAHIFWAVDGDVGILPTNSALVLRAVLKSVA